MIQFEGDRDIGLPPSTVWAKLSDARFLVTCIPDVESVKQAESSAATCVIRPGFAFVRGTLELSILVTEAVPDQTVGLHLRTKGIGNTSTVEALLTLAPQPVGTRVHWRAEVTEMGGLLKMVPEGLVRGAAQKVIADVWTAVEAHLRD
jgi:carbon monoxide dehydrogenase subunit G